jgi:DNA-binding Lrp family transcriptional regulator
MNSFEQQILDVIQDAFPLAERPYAVLAEKIGSDETTVFDAVEKMLASGVIRRIGGVYDSKKLGFISRLCAGKVPASSLDFFAEPHEQTSMEKFAVAVNGVPAITHNYIRSHEYNVWFTVIAENESEILKIVDKLCAATDLHDVHVMSATRKFKINTVMGASAPVDSRQLAVGRNSDERGTERHSDNRRLEESSEFRKTAVDLSESDKSRIRTSCEDIPHSLTPFKDWGVSCDELREDLASKRMRRFGAILRHQNAGFAFNAMVCFRIVDSRKSEVGRGSNVILSGEATKDPVKSCDLIAQAGSLLASNPHISHCYERPSFEGFPYNVYAMMHANSAELLDQIIADCVKALSALQQSSVEFVVLNSVRELKKTSFKFFA